MKIPIATPSRDENFIVAIRKFVPKNNVESLMYKEQISEVRLKTKSSEA